MRVRASEDLRTHCTNGHPITEPGTYAKGTNRHKVCLVCRRAQVNAAYAAKHPNKRLNYTESVRETTLRCGTCTRFLPDERFPRQRNNARRRQRATSCTDCRRRQRENQGTEISVEHVTRTPEQMGRAVPIYTPWPSKIREA